MTRWLPLMVLLACAPPPPVAAVRPPPLPLAQVVTSVEHEIARLNDVSGTRSGAGQLLGELNGKLNRHGYLRRVPADAALEGLESQLRQLATAKAVGVLRFEARLLPVPPAKPAANLQPGQRWQPTIDELRGVVALAIDLQGALPDVAAFIDALPTNVERLVVVHSAGRVAGGVRLEAETYYERELARPQLEIRWPSLDERLLAAGWQPNDPQVRADPQYEKLKMMVDYGRQQLPEVRKSLQISVDFPRHLLRAKFFDERAAVVGATRGGELLTRGGVL